MAINRNFLSTKRLYFSWWSESDYEKALKLWGNPNVTKFIARIATNHKVNNLLKAEINYKKKYGIQYYPLYTKSSNEFIGCCGLKIHDQKQFIYELGCHICEEFWNKGYAQEASVGMIKYAFSQLGANALFARHNPNNLASKLVLLKIGFKIAGEGYLKETGLYHPEYVLSKSEFEEVSHTPQYKMVND